MRLSVIASAVVAAMVGFGSTMALIAEAARHLGASPGQISSWATALCLWIAATSAWFSIRHRMPIVTAWSLAGAALALASPPGITLPNAVGAFLLSAALTVLAGALPPLEAAIARLPASIGGAMLAGLLLRFVVGAFAAAGAAPALVLPLLGVFLLARLVHPASAALVVIVAGVGLAAALGMPMAPVHIVLSRLEWMGIGFDPATLIGFGLPFFVVTMATQQLPGFAVLRVSGYVPPVRSVLVVTGIASLLAAPFGGYSVNLSSVTASICTGPETHPDPAKRWLAGPCYAACYLVLAVFAGSLITLFAGLPPALTATIVGVALAAPLTGALGAALAHERERFAAVIAFAVTASGVTLAGVGGAFWGLVAGLAVLGVERAGRRLRSV